MSRLLMHTNGANCVAWSLQTMDHPLPWELVVGSASSNVADRGFVPARNLLSRYAMHALYVHSQQGYRHLMCTINNNFN